MMDYLDFSAARATSQEAVDDLSAAGAQPVQHYSHLSTAYAADQPNPSYLNPNFPAPISCDIKPRLTKEQHDILEAHFQKQNKPNTNTKKGFAESLNVSLDKVNNWFQNRRAKLKQDAKKQHGALNLFQGHRRSVSESDLSPAYLDTTSQYHAVMQQWASEAAASNGLGVSQPSHNPDQMSLHGPGFPNATAAGMQMSAAHQPAQFNSAMFSSHEDINRRTLTQEQFDAMEQNGGMVNSFGSFEDFETTFGGDHNVMNTVFPDFNADLKQQAVYHYPIGAPMTSYDSTVPSNLSAESLPRFPSSNNMQPQASISAASSDWSESRSSSIHEGSVANQSAATATTQWQPGQSVPVDSNQQAEEFRQIRTQAQARSSPQQSMHEPFSPWADDAFVRRGSSTSLLAQSMSNVGIQTPPQNQDATFKSPAPPANIAARRQRPRPAALGVAALRSQSHSGAVQSASPNHSQPQQFNLADQTLRRIKSSNFLGNVAHGRIVKPTPGSAQRSPLHQSFADAMNSPHYVRHVSAQSHGSLAPPTPLSPKASSAMESTGQFHHWHNGASGSNQPSSIAETDAEHAAIYQTAATMSTPSWTSPPHTPMYHQNPVVQTCFSHPALENTPPQSAPAGQTCFPSNVFGVTHTTHPVHRQMITQPVAQQQVHAFPVPQPQHFVNSTAPDQQFHMSNVSYVPAQQMGMPSSEPTQEFPMHFSGGVPMVNAAGEVEMYFPAPVQYVPQQQGSGQSPPPHVHTPPQVYPFGSSASGSPSSQATVQLSKPSSDLFVHEYTPPDSVKRAATPRKGPAETVPKNYAFANTGPEHFEEKKSEEKKRNKSDGSSSSPASSNGTTLTA